MSRRRTSSGSASCSQLKDLPTLRELNCFVCWPSKKPYFPPLRRPRNPQRKHIREPDRRLPLSVESAHTKDRRGYPPAEGAHRDPRMFVVDMTRWSPSCRGPRACHASEAAAAIAASSGCRWRHLAVLEICTPAIQPSPEFGRRGGIEINGRALSR